MATNWNDNVFNCLRQVNHSLHGEFPLPKRASTLLYGMESALCSGDGLTDGTAFRAGSMTVVDRVVSLLGLGDSVRSVSRDGDVALVSLEDNPFGVNRLYFRI